MPGHASMTIASHFHEPFPTLFCWYKPSNHKDRIALPHRNAIKFTLINGSHSLAGRSTMSAAHSRQLSWFPLAGDSLLAGPFEADRVLPSHFDTPHFIFSCSPRTWHLRKSVITWQRTCLCHSAAGNASISEEKVPLVSRDRQGRDFPIWYLFCFSFSPCRWANCRGNKKNSEIPFWDCRAVAWIINSDRPYFDDLRLISQLLWTSVSLSVKRSHYLPMHLFIQQVYIKNKVCANLGA